ncbi:MAG TPA: universal stress protein [Thermoleophilaceae bacterium]|jgi:nucleotide-binding universal stress UspA family protein
MATNIIVSYDNTENDRDALALGRRLRDAGANVSLAYVRHIQLEAADREALEEGEAQRLLAEGAELLGDPDAPRHVVIDASTGEGLIALAEREGADLVVFGSDYRTAAGSVQPGNSARRLLDGGRTAVAIAPAGFRENSDDIATIGFIPSADDASAENTAKSLAAQIDAVVIRDDSRTPDLLVVGSRPEARDGHVLISAAADYAIETSGCPVIVTPRAAALTFAPIQTRVV